VRTSQPLKQLINTNVSLVLGFISLLMLTSVLVFVGLFNIDNTREKLANTVIQSQAKTALVSHMAEAANARTRLLLMMTVEQDPFKRDEYWIQFNHAGALFAQARQSYKDYVLSAEELALLELQGQLTGQSIPKQQMVFELIDKDKFADAKKILLTQAIPAQNHVSGTLQTLQRLLEISNEESIANALDVAESGKRSLIFISILTLFLGILIATKVTITNALTQRKVQGHLAEIEHINLALKNSAQALSFARDKAQEANNAKSQFLAKMSHELRTPLNAIIGYSEILKEEALELNHDKTFKDLNKIEVAGRNLLALINDILDLSKVESGKLDLFITEFDLENTIDTIRHTITPMLEKNHNQLFIQSPRPVGNILTDELRLQQVLLNLLSNAAKFTENGTITINYHDVVEDNLLIFQITDTGIGITEEQMEKLFQPFTQAEESTSSKYGGTGLGLTISKKFSEMMNGNLTVESKLGEGTSFTLSLPKRLDRRR